MVITSPEQAISALSEALRVLRGAGIIRSTRFVGDIGEWYVATLYDGELSASQAQKGWDVLERSTGARLQVKTQTFDVKNQWNYLTTAPDQFDRLIVVLLTQTFGVRDLYDIPSEDIRHVMRIGKENKPIYRFSDLVSWRVQINSLPGCATLGAMVTNYEHGPRASAP